MGILFSATGNTVDFSRVVDYKWAVRYERQLKTGNTKMTSYTISNMEHPTRPGLLVTDEDGNNVGIVYAKTLIASDTDSNEITEECSEFVLGKIISVEHDRDVIHVTTE